MSGNINDTNVLLIKNQVFDLIEDLEKYSKTSRNLNVYEEAMKKKYNYLYNTSKTLFNLIFNQFKTNKLDKEYFNFMVNKMLNYITKIQNNEMSQYDASATIGTELAEKYVPNLDKNTLDEIKKNIKDEEN
jgi:ADP-heptose:LPS heptosyltransferase